MKYFLIFALSALFIGCSMTAGGDMTTTTTVNPTISPDVKFNNIGEK